MTLQSQMAGIRCAATICIGILTAQASLAIDIPWQGTTGSYSDGSNWVGGSPPFGNFDDGALINNGGTAIVTDTPITPAWAVVGRGAGNSGALEIHSGGNLTIDGYVEIGRLEGLGHLTIERGGSLTANSIQLAGHLDSSMVLGQVGGSGTAQLTVNGLANLGRTTRIIGPNVAYQANSLNMSAAHRLVAELTGPTHSTINVSGTALLDGVLQVDASGFTPTFGQSWTLIDAADVVGSFSSVVSNAPLEPGLGLIVTKEGGGTNGQIVRMSVGVELALSVDRRTGDVALVNRSSHAIDIDGYLLTAVENVLNPTGWNSFQSSGLSDWRESNPSANHLGELNLDGTRTIGPQSTINLGKAYSFEPSALGESAENLTFEYRVAGGQTFDGKVEFTGFHNNLVLLVDPETGEAAIQNQSTYDLSVDGYLITSASGALSVDGWTSFQASGLSDWRESNPTANHLGELNLDGQRFLPGEGSRISIGTAFNPESLQDLMFEFRLAGGETLTGLVEYTSLALIAGDYNQDGVVDLADYTVWRNSLGQTGPGLAADGNGDSKVDTADYTLWKSNFGQPAVGAALAGANIQSVPEPATTSLLVLAAVVVAAGRYRGVHKS